MKSGDVTVSRSRRWTEFEEYLIPQSFWAAQRIAHYANLELPVDADSYLASLSDHLNAVTEEVDKRASQNQALTIDNKRASFIWPR